MFKMLRLLPVLLLTPCLLHSSASADIIGSQAFSISVTSGTGNIALPLTLTSLLSNSTQNGAFVGLGATSWGNIAVPAFDASSPSQTLTVSNTDFGTFTGQVDIDSVVGGLFRNIRAVGTWTPGTNAFFGGATNPQPSHLGITLGKSTSSNLISGAVVLDTNVSAVPEPSFVVLTGLFGLGLLWRHRRSERSRSSVVAS